LSLPVIGQRFGNYRAVSLLGAGGMGDVYLAEHPDIGRRVAIKVLRPEMIKDSHLLLRFLNEARAANSIRHPNIIEILDSGTTPEGTPYLVMELLEGEVLAARIHRLGKLPLADSLEFAYQTASALGAAHDKGIVHRDLKPDNLFIIYDPSDPTRERIKVLDFGIAKLQTLPSAGGMQTRTGTVIGTPVYMSPEQCLGTRTVDHRSDIYALGVIMFQMLAGRPPFVSEGFGELVNMHVNLPPPRLRELVPALSEAVEALVAKALAKDPGARHRSAAELQLDIRAAAGESIVIRGLSSPGMASATTMRGASTGPTLTFPSSTTLSSGTGERYAATNPISRAAPARRVLLGGLAAALVGGAAVFTYRRDTGRRQVVRVPSVDAPAPVSNHHPAAPVHLTIDSQPSGASVTDPQSGRALGLTPLVIERAAGQGPVMVRLEKRGFVTLTRAINLDRDRTETIPLSAVAPTWETSGTSRQPEKPGKSPRPRHVVVPPAGPKDEEPAKL
jgi:eukaryotic-like serine/threonine-protein kinase